MSRAEPAASVVTLPPELRVRVRDLGAMPYDQALAVQRDCQQQVIAQRTEAGGDGRMFLLLLEHDPPVITISRRPGAQVHLLATSQQLSSAGVELAQTDRGGDITYHGPGQLVVYPILDLNALGLRLNSYLRFLEQVVIDALARFDIHGTRDPNATGVWVECGGSASAKICAIGVRVSRWVTMHGLALNVTTNLDHFNLIVPCGLAGRRVTSMATVPGGVCPSMSAVKAAIVNEVSRKVLARMSSEPSQ